MPGKRWSIDRETDGRNGCDANAKAKWERDAPASLELRFAYHHGAESKWVALRGGVPSVVRESETVRELGRPGNECWESEVDYDALESRFTRCGLDAKEEDVVYERPARAAVFVLDGKTGRYRQRKGSGEVVDFDVATRAAGKRVRVTVRAARPLRAGEAFEIWTVGSTGKPIAWTATWDGATRAATSDLRADDAGTLGRVVRPGSFSAQRE
jgi:hypothetical protein